MSTRAKRRVLDSGNADLEHVRDILPRVLAALLLRAGEPANDDEPPQRRRAG